MTTGRTAVAPASGATWPATIRAEWTKMRTLPSTGWLLAGTAALSIAVSAAIVGTTHQSGGGGGQDPTNLALTGIDLGQAVIAVLGVLTMSEEYGTGMIRMTLTATPHRATVLVAKGLNLAGLTALAGSAAVAGSLIVGRLMLPDSSLDPAHAGALVSIAHAATLRAAVGSVIYLALIALLALGIATAIRDTAVAIGAVLAILYLPPLLAQLVSGHLHQHIQQIAPMTAGLAIRVTTDPSAQPIAPWAGLGVLAAWATGALVAGGFLLIFRDA
jgi:ABC-2 type transport system permease protein